MKFKLVYCKLGSSKFVFNIRKFSQSPWMDLVIQSLFPFSTKNNGDSASVY